MIIDCVSDLHGHFPKLEGGDLLIVAGDLTARDDFEEYLQFICWMYKQDYKQFVFIAGNHDNLICNDKVSISSINRTAYLCDSGMEFEGLKIWGSPWTKTFPHMNPHCKAFTMDTEEELDQKFSLIPNDVDILITHSPPLGFMDKVYRDDTGSEEHVGSWSLHKHLYSQRIRPKLHVFGHIHQGYGQIDVIDDMPGVKMVNASQVNEHYRAVNKPIRVVL